MHTGEMIRKKRKSKGMTLQELAKELKISASAVSQYERGIIFPSSETLLKIARALKCAIQEIATPEDCEDVWNLFENFPTAENYLELLEQKEHLSSILVQGGYKRVRDHLRMTNAGETEKQYFESLKGLLSIHDELNDIGRQRLFEYAEELARIPGYKIIASSPDAES